VDIQPRLISCVVPVFNGERYLREALDSILRQTYRALEVIVADDGSTDGTAEVVSGYGDQLRYLWQPNAGPTAARNLGLSAARGEYVAFLDADDLWHTAKLARQMARLRARPELDSCIAYVQNFWVAELSQEADRFRSHRLGRPVPGYVCGALLARRKVFETVGGFNASLKHGADTDWFLRASEYGTTLELLPDILVYRRMHSDNLSRRLASQSRDEYLSIVKASLERRRGWRRRTG
jgi:glycosyltransferase involved in cell wall biosynthesis